MSTLKHLAFAMVLRPVFVTVIIATLAANAAAAQSMMRPYSAHVSWIYTDMTVRDRTSWGGPHVGGSFLLFRCGPVTYGWTIGLARMLADSAGVRKDFGMGDGGVQLVANLGRQDRRLRPYVRADASLVLATLGSGGFFNTLGGGVGATHRSGVDFQLGFDRMYGGPGEDYDLLQFRIGWRSRSRRSVTCP